LEAVECGAASLGIILAYHGKHVPLEELRVACGVSRDGSKASNVLKAARTYGLEAKGFRKEIQQLEEMTLPLILFWNFNHFVVLEGFGKKGAFLNDPRKGPRLVSLEELNSAFTGVALAFKPGPEFKKGGAKIGVIQGLKRRLGGNVHALHFVVLTSLALVLPGLVVPVFSRIFVDEILVQDNSSLLRPLILGMAITALIRGAITLLQQHYLLRFETKLALAASARFFWHVLRLPIVFFTQRQTGEIAARVQMNDAVAQILSGQVAVNLLSMLMMIFYLVIMFQYSLFLSFLSMGIAAINLVLLKKISRYRTDANQRLLQEQGKLTGTALVGFQMIETLKATGGESDFFARWAGYKAKTLNAQQQLGLSTQFLSLTPPVLTAMNNAAVLGFGGALVMNGSISLGMLVAFQSLMSSFIEPVNRLVGLGGVLQSVQGNLKRLDDVLNYPVDSRVGASSESKSAERPVFKLSGKLELRNISFGYSRLEPPLVQNFSLVLHPGERVALVGPTGCGKSTISKLVCGLYDPWEGEVLLDGKPRAQIPPGILANSLAVVDQDIFLFEATIRENLTLWDSTAPDSRLIQASKDAHIHHDIAARPGGYENMVEEAGRNFSGGQRQRLEIARALVNDPTVLVLDEATSALDSKTEKVIDENLRRRGCTCLIIAHRLSTIRDCDEIIVLDKGKVVQRGTHDELAKQPGLYSELIKD